MNVNQKSMLEVTIELMGKKKKPQKAKDLIKETLQLKGYDDANGDLAAQLYIDITTSALFVYCGDAEWDLKTRQDISLGDKDGAYFSKGYVEEEEEDLNVTADDYELKVEEEETVEVDDLDDEVEVVAEEDEIIDDEPFIPYSTDDDDDFDDSMNEYIDEDVYNDYMDDYEGLYDDK
ncbi:MAG: DNA-directed RNA polymerase subunit delta [bacterium]